MSVAELVVTGAAACCVLTGVHELFRIHFCQTSINLIAHSFSSKLSYQGLTHILLGTFDQNSVHNPKRKDLELQIEKSVRVLMKSQLLGRSWFSFNQDNSQLLGVRVWLSGPHSKEPKAETVVRIQVCISSWLERPLGIITDQRNCLGQFSGQENMNASRGLSIAVTARRKADISIDPYLAEHLLVEKVRHTK